VKYDEVKDLRPADEENGWYRVLDPGAVNGRSIEVTIVMDKGKVGIGEMIAAIDLPRRMIEWEAAMDRKKIVDALTAEVEP
jgi:hypothetical protein